jgi:hypothetical protein
MEGDNRTAGEALAQGGYQITHSGLNQNKAINIAAQVKRFNITGGLKLGSMPRMKPRGKFTRTA